MPDDVCFDRVTPYNSGADDEASTPYNGRDVFIEVISLINQRAQCVERAEVVTLAPLSHNWFPARCLAPLLTSLGPVYGTTTYINRTPVTN